MVSLERRQHALGLALRVAIICSSLVWGCHSEAVSDGGVSLGPLEREKSFFFNETESFDARGRLRGEQGRRRLLEIPEEEHVFTDDEPESPDYVKLVEHLEAPAHESLFLIKNYVTCSAIPIEAVPPSDGSAGIVVEFDGEFGYEMLAVLPYAYYHYVNGGLLGTVSCGDSSMSVFYFFSPNHQTNPRCKRHFKWEGIRQFGWTRGLHESDIPKAWTPPPLSVHFSRCPRVWQEIPKGAKLVIIANKFSREWDKAPVNFLDVKTLRTVLNLFLEAGFYVVYNRAQTMMEMESREEMHGARLDDFKVVRKMYLDPNVGSRIRVMQDIYKGISGISYNELQLRLMSRAKCFTSVQGGTSILSSYFGGRNLIYAREGHEVEFNVFPRVYPRLSGAEIVVTNTYADFVEQVKDMIANGPCETQ